MTAYEGGGSVASLLQDLGKRDDAVVHETLVAYDFVAPGIGAYEDRCMRRKRLGRLAAHMFEERGPGRESVETGAGGFRMTVTGKVIRP